VFFYRCTVPVRTEQIPPFSKETKSQVVQRKFTKETSVFDSWRVDNDRMLKTIIEEDSMHWKLPKFIKDENDRDMCLVLIQKNVTLLKKVFINLVSQGGCFPNIGMIDFSIFIEKCKINDKAINLSTVDRCFIATNQGSDTNNLCRYQFWEILVRIAQNKYKDTGVCSTFHESLDKMIKECVVPNYHLEDWQEFRD